MLKKIIIAVIVLLVIVGIVVSSFGIWIFGRMERDKREHRLHAIGYSAKIYSVDNDDKFPPDFSTFVKFCNGCFEEPVAGDTSGSTVDNWYISPADSRRKPVKGGAIREGDSSYVFVGLGFPDTGDSVDLPLAFEKIDIVAAEGDCAVVFCGGHSSIVKMKAKSNREIAEILLADDTRAPKELRDAVIARAAAADELGK